MKQEYNLLAVGDIGTNRDNPDSIFNGVRETLKNGDLLFGQLEPCLSNVGTPLPQARLPMRGNPAGAEAIKAAGFDVISFATNHCMDWGREAFFDTIENLKANDLKVIGAGANLQEARKPVIVTLGDTKIAFLGYNSIIPQNYFATKDRPGCAPFRALTAFERIEHDQPETPVRLHSFPLWEDLQAMTSDIKEIRKQADIVAVSFHWGIHFVPAILAEYQKIGAYAAIEAGADIILGHHTHILKPIEIYKGKAIIYSMANFALDPPFLFAENLDLHNTAQHKELQELNKAWKDAPNRPMPPDSYKSLIIKVNIRDKEIKAVSFLPVQLDEASNPFVLTAENPEFNEIVSYMEEISANQEIITNYKVRGNEVIVVEK